MGWRGWKRCVRGHEKKSALRQIHFFVVEKYVKDVEQDQKKTPDLLESIMRVSDPVEEELRRKTTRMNQF